MLPFLPDRERFAIIIQTSDLLEDLIMLPPGMHFRLLLIGYLARLLLFACSCDSSDSASLVLR